MQTLKVQPHPDRQVRDPRTGQHLPAKAVDVPNTPYWRRRLRDGDVVSVTSKRKEQ